MRVLLNTNQGNEQQWSSAINTDVCVCVCEFVRVLVENPLTPNNYHFVKKQHYIFVYELLFFVKLENCAALKIN